jgi:hypothetical protein
MNSTLFCAEAREILVARENSETGRLHIHFPHADFDVIGPEGGKVLVRLQLGGVYSGAVNKWTASSERFDVPVLDHFSMECSRTADKRPFSSMVCSRRSDFGRDEGRSPPSVFRSGAPW